MSSNNPFRTLLTQSSGSGLALQSQRQESPPLPSLPSPDEPSPSEPTSRNNHSSAGLDDHLPTQSDPSGFIPGPADPDIRLDDDLPPAYTPAADPSIGEETLEVGPRRPFQPAPPRPGPSSSSHGHSNSGPHRPFPPPSGAYSQPWSTNTSSQSLAPWQSPYQYRQPGRGGGGLIGALLRDIVGGPHDDMVISQRANASAYAAPYSSPSGYVPPSGPPPQAARLPPNRPRSTPPRSPSTIADDGTPTERPVPGHPLLRDGKLLVYPRDHLCVKCKNTGYKNYDPDTPCRKCWEKYARPYIGALTYTPWSSSGNDPRMQRALPKFTPPHLAPSANPGSYSGQQSRPARFPPPPQHPQHNRSISHPSPPSGGASYYVVNPLISWDSTPPVPHAIPVSPGDPRLGGLPCPGCGGEGMRTLFLFDSTTCEVCGGTGRVWR